MNKKMALVLHAVHVDTHLALSLESTFPLVLRMYKVGVTNWKFQLIIVTKAWGEKMRGFLHLKDCCCHCCCCLPMSLCKHFSEVAFLVLGPLKSATLFPALPTCSSSTWLRGSCALPQASVIPGAAATDPKFVLTSRRGTGSSLAWGCSKALQR